MCLRKMWCRSIVSKYISSNERNKTLLKHIIVNWKFLQIMKNWYTYFNYNSIEFGKYFGFKRRTLLIILLTRRMKIRSKSSRILINGLYLEQRHQILSSRRKKMYQRCHFQFLNYFYFMSTLHCTLCLETRVGIYEINSRNCRIMKRIHEH